MTARHRWIAALAAAAVMGCGDSTGLDLEDLLGTWEAQSYTFSDSVSSLNLVATQGASFTMTVTADGTVSTVFDNGIGGTSSNSGAFSSDAQTLTLSGNAFAASRSGDNLTLVDATAEYDLDDDGSDDPATLTITLQRN